MAITRRTLADFLAEIGGVRFRCRRCGWDGDGREAVAAVDAALVCPKCGQPVEKIETPPRYVTK